MPEEAMERVSRSKHGGATDTAESNWANKPEEADKTGEVLESVGADETGSDTELRGGIITGSTPPSEKTDVSDDISDATRVAGSSEHERAAELGMACSI